MAPSETLQERPLAAEGAVGVRPLTPRIGAEITGVELNRLSAEAKRQIYEAWLKHKVVFFRGQAGLTTPEFEAFAETFGEPVAPPTIPVVPGSRFVLELHSEKGGRADDWHTDASFTMRPDKATVLRSLVVPEDLGDTVWGSTAAAYEDLPEPLKRLAEALRVQHSNDYDHTQPPPPSNSALTVLRSKVLRVEHPAVQTHPETGERCLLMGAAAKRFAGFNRHETEILYHLLQTYVTKPQNTVRWRWRTGDVVVWDNRATQHIALQDYGDRLRIMNRISVRGEPPLGIDNQVSSKLLEY
jgi:taurine dioxygenase